MMCTKQLMVAHGHAIQVIQLIGSVIATSLITYIVLQGPTSHLSTTEWALLHDGKHVEMLLDLSFYEE